VKVVQRLAAFLVLFFAVGTAAQAAAIHIVNHSKYIILSVYISPAYAERWGDDQLGEDQAIFPGQNWSFQFVAGSECHWDFRAVFKNNDPAPVVRRNVDLCAYDTPTWTLTSETGDYKD
jgi:hypothetical protein